MILQPGARLLPEYVLVRKRGAGAFGEVWHAKGPGGLDVALKFIRLDESVLLLELRSLDVMKSIRHPNLVSLFGAWHKEPWLVLAMELCDCSLLDRLTDALGKKQVGIPSEQLLRYMSDAATGLDVLNAKQVQHRDVKPANLLLVNDGVKIADFGLAKVLEQTVASNSGAGTLAYTAPECFRGQLAKQSDQYSLAVTYCHLRTGELLFKGNQAEVMYAHLSNEPDLSRLQLSERPILARALAKEPGKRWPDCTAFVAELANSQRIIDVAKRHENAFLVCNRGIERLTNASYDLAMADFDEAISIMPNMAYSYILRGLASLGRRAVRSTITDFDEAIQRDTKSALELLNLATNGSLNLQTGYGEMGSLLMPGNPLREATIQAVAFGLLGIMNGTQGDRGEMLCRIQRHMRNDLAPATVKPWWRLW